MPENDIQFFDELALLERLSRSLKKRRQEVVFFVGSPFSAPTNHGMPGVPGVDGMIELIRQEFNEEPDQLKELSRLLSETPDRRYQSAFQFLQGRRGQQTANEIVRKAVLMSRNSESVFTFEQIGNASSIEETCRLIDLDSSGWFLNPGTESIGKLVTAYPERFGRALLTTNFDPLVEVSIRRAGGNFFRTTLHSDGNFAQTEGTGCHVIHLHGYWYGSDTLHTIRQLTQPRPRLKSSLSSLLRNKLFVICGYGGWDDIFTDALMEIVRDDSAYPEVLWSFFSNAPDPDMTLFQRVAAGLDRGRVTLYKGIDCNQFFPKLQKAWLALEPETALAPIMPSNPVRLSSQQASAPPVKVQHVLEGDEEDRPPVVDICVGRERELRLLRESNARVAFLTGFGGQGKSTLAAKYFADCQKEERFSVFVWRDCKEEGEHFENQLASVVSKLSGGFLSRRELARRSVSQLLETLSKFIARDNVLFVFDNVDHYVNLETQRMVGSADLFIHSFLQSESGSKVIFTCRPMIQYDHQQAVRVPVEGLDINAAIQLFAERHAPSTAEEIVEAHSMTEGHAFWLDLLALQVRKRSVELSTLVSEIRDGVGLLPEKMLNSVWETLRDREQLVLRAMAETVKPETEVEIADYLRHQVTYAKVIRALNQLRALNLVVVKRRTNARDVHELHPLVRQFIRRHFTRLERIGFIDAIINVYKSLIGRHKSQLGRQPSLSVLEYWTQTAELDIAAEKYEDAFSSLAEVADSFRASAYPREHVRVARLLLAKSQWATNHNAVQGFELVFRAQIRNLGYLGEYDEAERLLDTYATTLIEKDVRYIHYCEMRCFLYWIKGEYSNAIRWGEQGLEIKEASGVDTQYDIGHILALARRDAGEPELALPVFLAGRTLKDVVDPEELDEKRGGAFYGNIGRSLHMMGQIDPALICYQKSALMLERNPQGEHVLNQGYIRSWIGELLISRQQFKLARIFFKAAYFKWEQLSPPKAERLLRLISELEGRIASSVEFNDRDSERICLDWIFGRTNDAEFQ